MDTIYREPRKLESGLYYFEGPAVRRNLERAYRVSSEEDVLSVQDRLVAAAGTLAELAREYDLQGVGGQATVGFTVLEAYKHGRIWKWDTKLGGVGEPRLWVSTDLGDSDVKVRFWTREDSADGKVRIFTRGKPAHEIVERGISQLEKALGTFGMRQEVLEHHLESGRTDYVFTAQLVVSVLT